MGHARTVPTNRQRSFRWPKAATLKYSEWEAIEAVLQPFQLEAVRRLRANRNKPTSAIELFGSKSNGTQGWINIYLQEAHIAIRLVQFGELANSHHKRLLAFARLGTEVRVA